MLGTKCRTRTVELELFDKLVILALLASITSVSWCTYWQPVVEAVDSNNSRNVMLMPWKGGDAITPLTYRK